MSQVLNVIWVVFWGLLVLSALVFVHEGGHYLAARAFHVRASEFFLGLPSRFKLSRKSKTVGTEFGVTPLLLGGYTRICGMENTDDELLGPALALVMERGRVKAAEVESALGVDEERAYVLLGTLADWGSIRPYFDPELGERPGQSEWPAAFETLARDANLLTEYDRGHDFSLPGSTEAGAPHPTTLSADELIARERTHVYQGASFLKRVVMLAAGPLVNIVLAFLIVTFALTLRGVDYSVNENVIGSVDAGSIAEAAGIEPGDEVIAVDGVEVTTWDELLDAMATPLAAGDDLDLTCVRDGQRLAITVELDGQPTELVGIEAPVATYHPSLLQSAQVTVSYVGIVAEQIGRLLQPQHTMEVLGESSSVVGISVIASEAAASGAYELAVVVAAISLSLGFMNLLPIPPFDGGKILIEVVQLVIRRPLSARVQNALSYVGLALMLFVFVIVLKNDIFRYVLR